MKAIAAGLVAAFSVMWGVTGAAQAQVPSGYPASYSELLAKAKAEGKVVVYSNMAATQWGPFVKWAAAKYPWLKIEATDSGEEMWEKYYAESRTGAATADVMLTNSVDRWPQLAERGQIAEYDSPEKPALPAWSMPIPGLYTVSVDPTILVYNKHLIAPGDAPKSRADILALVKKRPELKGKITSFDPRGNSLALSAYWALTRSRPDAWPLLEALGPYFRPEVSAGTVREKLVSGEYAVTIMTSGAGIFQFERPEIKAIVTYLYPTDGVPLSMRNVAITKAAKNPNAARFLVDLMLSREGQIALAQGGLTPYRDDLKKGDVPYTTYSMLRDQVGEQNLILIKPDAIFASEREPMLARWERLFK